MATPTWLAATSGQPTRAGQINQYLGTHSATFTYAGAIQSQQNTAGTGSQTSLNTFVAQSFTTASTQTTVGRVLLTIDRTGTPPPITVSLEIDVSGAPSGTPIVSTLLPMDFLGTTSGQLSIPLPAVVSPSTKYWVVLNATGTTGNVFNWFKSNQTSGASTSPTGVTWTAQTFGLLYILFDNTLLLPVTHTWEDGGARWTAMSYNGLGQLNAMNEFTQGQTATGYLTSARIYTYASGQLTGIA